VTDRRTDRRTTRSITIAGPHIVADQLIIAQHDGGSDIGHRVNLTNNVIFTVQGSTD